MYKLGLGRGLLCTVVNATTAASLLFIIILGTSLGITAGEFDDCDGNVAKEEMDWMEKYFHGLPNVLKKNAKYKDIKGSVEFINTAHTHIKLECPCTSKNIKWELDIDDSSLNAKENQARKEDMEKFNEHYKDYKEHIIKAKLSSKRYYLRIYKCTDVKSKKMHYFYVWTRPTPITSWPIQWVDGQSGITFPPRDPSGTKQPIKGTEFRCSVDNYNSPKVKNYGPYTISWVLPLLKDDTTKEELEHGDIVKGKVNLTEKVVTSESALAKNGYHGLKFEFINHGHEKYNPEIGPQSIVTTQHKKGEYGKANLDMAGRYECVIVDGNNVTSSWRGFHHKLPNDMHDHQKRLMKMNFPAPENPFTGFVQVRVRASIMTYIPLGVIVGTFIILALVILGCPNNTDDIDPTKKPMAPVGLPTTVGQISTVSLNADGTSHRSSMPRINSRAGMDEMSVQGLVGEQAAATVEVTTGRKSKASVAKKRKN